jgi:hypothetical protein
MHASWLPGQRCMAISAAVFVGGICLWKDALIAKAKSLKVGLSPTRSTVSARSTCQLCEDITGAALFLSTPLLAVKYNTRYCR